MTKALKSVLIITYYWPPSGGAGVQRWLKFVKYLPEYGFQPHVYTPSNPEAPALDQSLLKDVPKEAVIIKRPILEPYGMYKKFTGKKGNVNAGFLSEDKNSRAKFTERLSVWVRGNLFIPDARVMWVKPSVRFLSDYIKKHKIDTVISTGPPHSMHLIALQLKQKLNVKWLADFRDPWTNIDFYKDLMLTTRSDRKHHQLEQKVLKYADCIVTIGKTMAQEFSPLSEKEPVVISNGFDEAEYDAYKRTPDKHFSIVHAGSVNADRNHKIFWEALADLCRENPDFRANLELKFVGKTDYTVIDDARKYGLEEKLTLIGYIPHNEIISHQKNASVLYLPMNNTPNAKGVVTGKFFEYLAAKRPIVAIGDPDGDLQEMISTAGAGNVVDFNDLESLKHQLRDYFRKFQDGKLEPDAVGLNRYSRKTLTGDLAEILHRL